MRSLCRVIALTSSLLLAACSSFTPADPQRGALEQAPTPLAWPARDTAVLNEFAAKTTRDVFGLEWRHGADRSKATREEMYLTTHPDLVVTHTGVHGLALLRLYDDHRPSTRPDDLPKMLEYENGRLGFRPNGNIITSRGLTLERAKEGARERGQYADFQNLIREKEGLVTRASDALLTSRLIDGMGVRIPAPLERPARGLIFHFHAMQANPGERAVMREMVSRGWAVVDFQTDCRIDTPPRKENLEKLKEAQRHAEFTWSIATKGLELPGPDGTAQTVVLQEPLAMYDDWKKSIEEARELREGAFELTAETDAGALGAEIAALTDDAIASNAYAAEAVMLYIREHRRDLLHGPFVLMGFSAGSLVTPAAAARLRQMSEPPRVSAVVLVGAGADLFLLSQKSTLTDGGITIKDGKKRPSPARLEEVHKAYRSAVRLDPCVSAEQLRTTPVLQVHATRDDWVPHEGGDILYEALGKPDRLAVRAGHIRLFYTLGLYADRIADWVGEKAPEAR